MNEIATQAAALALIDADTPIEDVADVMFRLEGMAQRIREMRAVLEVKLIERIKERGEFSIGDVRYFVATPRKVTARDAKAVLNRLLEVTGGDVDRIVGCLSSGCWKHGTVRRLLEELAAPPETFNELFETTYDDELREGKLVRADAKFVR